MVSGSVPIVGEPFKDYVSAQIIRRQEIHGSGLVQGTPKSPQQIQYINGSNAWLKMASSVKIDAENGGQERLQELGFNDTDISSLTGTQLAKSYVLFNGTTTDTNPLDRFGIRRSNTNQGQEKPPVYGTSGIDFGLQAMPGLISFNVSHANRGSIRQGDIKIRANSLQQFEILQLLYIRLGFTMLIEWGNSMYFDNNNPDSLLQMGPTLIDDGSWFTEEGIPHLEFFDRIESKRKEYQGNYDAFFCKVYNFNWNFTEDGYYDITIKVISMGDVIESFKVNSLSNDSILPTNFETTDETQKNKNSISNFLYCKKKEKNPEEDKEINTEVRNSDYVSVIDFTDVKGRRYTADPKKLYYIRLGTLLEYIDENVMIKDVNGTDLNESMLEVNTGLENYMNIFPGLVSTNPSICYIQNNLPFSRKGGRIGENQDTKRSVLYFKEIALNKFVGHIMNIYINFDHIDNILLNELDADGSIDLFTFLDKLCKGINGSLGNYVRLAPKIIDEEKTYSIVDENINYKTSTEEDNEEKQSPEFLIYGVDNTNNRSNFVRSFAFKTEISNRLATTITVGATANNQSTTDVSDFFSRLNKGLVDRYQQEKKEGNDEDDKKDSLKLKCAEEKQETPIKDFFVNVFEKIKYDISNQTKALRDLIVPDDKFTPLQKKLVLYLTYLEKMFSSNDEEFLIPRYFELKPDDMARGQQALISYINEFYTQCSEATEKETTSSQLGFIPIEFDLTIDGLSGMKIYNQVRIDTRFLPPEYRNTIDFVIAGVQHTIENNQWLTTINTIGKPSKNITNVILETGNEQNTMVDDIIDTPDDQLVPNLYPPTNNININGVIRNDAGGSGAYQASRSDGKRKHDGIDLRTTVGQNIFAPISGIASPITAKTGLPGFQIIGKGEYSGMLVRIFYAQLVPGRVPNNGRVDKGTFYAKAVDLSPAYSNRVTDHIHFEVYRLGKQLNPSELNYSFDV